MALQIKQAPGYTPTENQDADDHAAVASGQAQLGYITIAQEWRTRALDPSCAPLPIYLTIPNMGRITAPQLPYLEGRSYGVDSRDVPFQIGNPARLLALARLAR